MALSWGGMDLKGLIVVLSFISAGLVYYLLLRLFAGKNDYMSRLGRYTNVEELRDDRRRSRKREGSAIRGAVSREIGKIKFLDGYKKKIQIELTRGHLLVKAEEFLAFNLIMFFL